ncbi:MAG TPA: type 1 glutamine amidotransferase [Gaiellaceae bacterium]|nr:type 1 glutamine amidotransferase [Gaiellaceae bacterium]
MNVLSIVHPGDAGSELFGPFVAGLGHRFEERSFAEGTPQLDGYDAVLVFGGPMHVDQDEEHPWLRDESAWLDELVEGTTPTLGICLGSQLLAQAAGAKVGPLPEPEIGWSEVEITGEGFADPVLSALPSRFVALEWHHYGHELPQGAVALAHSSAALQGFRLGETCWGVQFHPEVTEPQLERWIAAKSDVPAEPEVLRAETRERIGGWNELGRRLCRSFLAAAERLRAG